MPETRYEYGVDFRDVNKRGYRYDAETPHRTGMTQDQADDWVSSFVLEGGNPSTFVVRRRLVSDWEDDPGQ